MSVSSLLNEIELAMRLGGIEAAEPVCVKLLGPVEGPKMIAVIKLNQFGEWDRGLLRPPPDDGKRSRDRAYYRRRKGKKT